MDLYDNTLDTNIDKILDDNSLVVGDIYLITNKVDGKQYVGQAKSHRLNHGRYRPFGYKRRFDDHCSQARTTQKKTQYILNSIRKYGECNFTSQLILRCRVDEMDKMEELYIQKFNTLYPNGYNLTTGGSSSIFVRVKHTEDGFQYEYKKQHRDHQTKETIEKISSALKAHCGDAGVIQDFSNRAKLQHDDKRRELFQDVHIDPSKFKDYISSKRQGKGKRFTIRVDNTQTTFYSSIEDESIVEKRALDFLNSLVQRHDQIAGTSL